MERRGLGELAGVYAFICFVCMERTGLKDKWTNLVREGSLYILCLPLIMLFIGLSK